MDPLQQGIPGIPAPNQHCSTQQNIAEQAAAALIYNRFINPQKITPRDSVLVIRFTHNPT